MLVEKMSDYTQVMIESNRSDWHRILWAKFDVADAEVVAQHVWHVTYDGRMVYPQTSLRLPDGQRRAVSMGRLLLGEGELGNLGRIDHINGNGMDSRRANLRLATQSQVLAKRRPAGGRSPYKGVTWDRGQGKWLAVFRGKKVGRFHSEKDAARAFDEAALAFWGPDAYLNFPPRPRQDMTRAKARLLTFAIEQCLDAADYQDDDQAAAILRAARDGVARWHDLPPEWIPVAESS